MKRITVTAGAWLEIEKPVPQWFLDQLELRLSYQNPDRARAERAGQRFEHLPSRWVAMVDEPDRILIPRGALEVLRSTARSRRLEIDWRSNVVSHHPETPDPGAMVLLEDFAIQPRPYQRDAIELMMRKVQGVVVLPCGGGKTTTGLLGVLHLGQPALILVPSTDLLEQWAGTHERATSGDRPRLIGGGNRPDWSPLGPGEVAVATVASLAGNPKADALIDSAAILVIDEAHHIAADTWQDVAGRCRARWRWLLTATPERADGWTMLLRLLGGPTLFQMEPTELVDLGYLVRPVVIPVDTGWAPDDECFFWIVTCPDCGWRNKVVWGRWQDKKHPATCKGKTRKSGRPGKGKTECRAVLPVDAEHERDRMQYAIALNKLSAHSDRLDMAILLADSAREAGRRTLVLWGRRKQLGYLASELADLGAESGSVSSNTRKRERERVIDDFRTGRLDTLVASQLADEGLDVPELDCTVLGQPGKAKGRAQQRLGRGCRPSGHAVPVAFDLVDRGSAFRRQWRSRRNAYEEAYGSGCVMFRHPVPLEEALKAFADLSADGQKQSG